MNKNKFITSARAKKNNAVDLYTFIIIADTPGYRMKSHGPSSLIPFKKKKLLDIQIDSIIKSFEKSEIIVCCGYSTEKVYKYVKSQYSNLSIRVVENQIFNNSNACESVRIAMNNTMNNKIYILDGNLLLNPKIFENKINESYVYVENEPCENLEVGININEKKFVEHFSYGAFKPWSEIVYLSNKETVECFRKIISCVDFKNKFLFEGLNELLKVKDDLKYLENTSPVIKVNNIKTYHSIKEKV